MKIKMMGKYMHIIAVLEVQIERYVVLLIYFTVQKKNVKLGLTPAK